MSKESQRVYQTRHYRNNKEYYKRKRKERQVELTNRVAAIKDSLRCALCPEDDPVALDFHHCDPDEKEEIISRLCHLGRSWPKIVAEIEKCACLCANCHRKVHKHQEWADKLTDEHRIRVGGENG